MELARNQAAQKAYENPAPLRDQLFLTWAAGSRARRRTGQAGAAHPGAESVPGALAALPLAALPPAVLPRTSTKKDMTTTPAVSTGAMKVAARAPFSCAAGWRSTWR